MNALYWTMGVHNEAVVSGELRVTLHGEKPSPQFTYVLRDGERSLLRE